MKYNLYLDDFRDPIDSAYYMNNSIYEIIDWIVVRNYNEFIKCVEENGIPEVISFDHDLADSHYQHQSEINYDVFSEKTGYDCAKWFIDYIIDNNLELPKTILIHSMNPAGSLNIKSLFDSYIKSLNI